MLVEKLKEGNLIVDQIEILNECIDALKETDGFIIPAIGTAISKISRFDLPFVKTIVEECICKLAERKAKLEFDLLTL